MNSVELGEVLGNVSEACRKLSVSRLHYYDIKKTLKEIDVEGLLEKARTKPKVSNRVAPEVEDRILAYSLEFPTHGQVRVENELKREGIMVSAGGVRGVWLRHGLERKSALKNGPQRPMALESSREEREAHGEIETHDPAFLLDQDTYYVSYIKGVGKIYQQTGIDTFSNFGFAKVYNEKNAITAADFLNDKVLPFFDEHGMSLLRTLTDRGTEYCVIPEVHPYQLFLHLNDNEHTRTKARHPQANGMTEKLNQTIQEGIYAVAFRKRLYESMNGIAGRSRCVHAPIQHGTDQSRKTVSGGGHRWRPFWQARSFIRTTFTRR